MSESNAPALLKQMEADMRKADEECLELEQEAAYAALLGIGSSSEEDAEERSDCLGVGPKRRKHRAGGWGRQPRNGSTSADATLGEQWRFQSQKSPWWNQLRDPNTLNPNSAAGRKFRGHFRVPRSLFDKLVTLTRESGIFPAKELYGDHSFGPLPQPLELKILATLRYLACGADFALMEELACVSSTVLERCFHKWTAWVGSVLFAKWVTVPTTETEISAVEAIYSRLGFPGTVCSIDGVHVPWHTCPVTRTNLHVGKEGYPTRAFNVAVGPTRQIFHVSPSHPGARNDKMISKYDWFMQQIRNGMYAWHAFNAFDQQGKLVSHKGLHAITDAGYCRWFCIIFPLRHPSTLRERRWSKRCESVRKDTERTFWVLKKRFYILKSGFRFRSADKIDNTFFTCCVLHNMLLDNDGLNSIGEKETDWREVDFQRDNERIERDLREEQQAGTDACPGASSSAPLSSNGMASGADDQCLPLQQQTTAHAQDNGAGASSGGRAPCDDGVLSMWTLTSTPEEDAEHNRRRRILLDHFEFAYAAGGVQWLQAAEACRPRLKSLFECEDRESEGGDDEDLEAMEDDAQTNSGASEDDGSDAQTM